MGWETWRTSVARMDPLKAGPQAKLPAPPMRVSGEKSERVFAGIPYSSRVLADVHEHSQAGQGADQAAAAVADHGQRDAFGGHHSQYHAHVHEALDYHHHGQA